MMASLDEDVPELLFFDTFSHDINEELNLDLVQFPKPVYITEVRIIPLGARVQADFPGGVRLGATNPSEFHVDFFVNDLGKPGASTFENLGNFDYNQNDCINLECGIDEGNDNYRQIPTDGLVLRGWYTTVTLAVYGTFTKQITEQISSPPNSQVGSSAVPVQITTPPDGNLSNNEDWTEDIPIPIQIIQQFAAANAEVYTDSYENREYQPEEYFGSTAAPVGITIQADIPKDPRSNFTVDPSWNQSGSGNEGTSLDRDWDIRRSRRRSISPERPISRGISRSREKSRGYSRSSSREREYSIRLTKRDWSRSPTEYRSSGRTKTRGSPAYDHGRSFERRSPENDELRKRPRTPPMNSPRRPRSPERRLSDVGSEDELRYRNKSEKVLLKHIDKTQPIRVIPHLSPVHLTLDEDRKPASPPEPVIEKSVKSPSLPEEDTVMGEEQFEPILSDEEIGDETENLFELEYEFAEYEDVTKQFNPFIQDLVKFELKNENNEIAPSLVDQQLTKEFDIITKILHKFRVRCGYFQYPEFLSLTPDTKECWVHFVEQFIQMMSQFNNNSIYYSRNKHIDLIKSLVGDSEIMVILVDWIQIGLNFEMSLSQPQPGYKIRHLKAGVKIIEVLLCYDSLAKLILFDNKLNVFENLFQLYKQEYMALSIKLMIIKSIHSALDSKTAMEFFLEDNHFTDNINGYQILLNKLYENPLTRVKFALKSLVKKINHFESLQLIKDIIEKHITKKLETISLDADFILLANCLTEIHNSLTFDEISYTQPKRFLPVSAKFDISTDPSQLKSISIGFLLHYKANAFLETILLLITYQNNVPQHIIGLTYDIIEALLKKPHGIEYLCENVDIVNMLVKHMLRNEKENGHISIDGTTRSCELGIELWFKIHTKLHIDALINIKNETEQLVEVLHSFYSLTCNTIGKAYVIEIITMDNHIEPILNIIETERKTEAIIRQGPPEAKTKSPVLNYAVDLIDCTIRNCFDLHFLEIYGVSILDFVKNHELFESSVSAMFQEMAIYMKPLEIPNVFSYNDITGLSELIKRSIEFITTFPGDLIMALRIVRHLGIPPYDDFTSSNETEVRSIPEHYELRYKFIILDFYSHEGVATIISILDKLTTFFEQPAIHSSFGSLQGAHIVQILLPSVEILRRMLTYVIKCRNTCYKDLTSIEPLLKTFSLLYHFPINGLAYKNAKRTQAEIIKTLLAFTQPSPLQGVDTESVHKSLWTQMIGEILKYILTGPFTFVPGLLAFSELLPLPLPVLTKDLLSQKEINKMITERQLWSAHLHPQSTSISEMIQTIAISSNPQLLLILTRLCLQLSDLAPNMTLLVTKSVIDLIFNEVNGNSNLTVTPQLTRLLKLAGDLVSYPSIKVSVLSLLPGKLMDILSSILVMPSSTNINQMHAEENVKIFISNLLDSDISMVSPVEGVGSRELTLACAVPSKEIVISIAHCLLENLTLESSKPFQLMTTLRTLGFLTDHDFTLYHLRTSLESKIEKFNKTLKQICDISSHSPKTNPEYFQLINATLEFLLSLIVINEPVIETAITQIPLRTITLTQQQFGRILMWKPISLTSQTSAIDENSTSFDNGNDEHPIFLLKLELEKLKSSLDSPEPEPNEEKIESHEADSSDTEIQSTISNEKSLTHLILENVYKIIEYLERPPSIAVSENSNSSSSFLVEQIEPILPQAEGIVTQYGSRQFFIILHEFDDRLNVNYWLNSHPIILEEPAVELLQQETERIPFDLAELIKNCLPAETNITSECKRLLHLSASPQATRERTTTAPCYRTRRVEVEPSTGRPEKKIFVTPMRGRGFQRTPPSRGDLFRSRPPNTSRPPSLHVDDFLALETCGAQPTGPTGYNKLSREIISIRGTRGRGRGFGADRGRIPTVGAAVPSPVAYRQAGPWPGHMGHLGVDMNMAPPQHFRTATSEPVVSPHFPTDPHYPQPHFGGPSRGRIARGFSRGRPFQRQI